MSGCGLTVDANNNLYFETGNGVFDSTNGPGGTEYGTSFVKLSTTNGLAVSDYFTPWNQVQIGEGKADTDLGSSGCVLLPDQPGPFPVILQRLPYNKDGALSGNYGRPEAYAVRCYIVIAQDAGFALTFLGRLFDADHRADFDQVYDLVKDPQHAAELAKLRKRTDELRDRYGGAYRAMPKK